MIVDVIDTFKNTTTAANQELVRKSQIETSTCYGVNAKMNKYSGVPNYRGYE